jgi:hypothetical protein
MAGSVVKVVSLESDSLKIESDGFLGTVNVEKTDFWDRAERTRSAAIERQNQEQALVKQREEREAQEKKWRASMKRYEDAPVLEIEISQVLNNGCLVRVLNDDRKSIFLELTGPDLAEDQRYKIRAERSGIFKYTTVLGAPKTVERWTSLRMP